jgi:hypothetical protein
MSVRQILVVGLVAAALLASACKHKDGGYHPPEEVSQIPREKVIDNLRELVPLMEEFHCAAPKESLRQSDIREWIVGNDSIEVRPIKKQPIVLTYADIRETPVLQQSGKVFRIRIFTYSQKDTGKEQFEFHWRSQEHAQRMIDYLESLRTKK